MCFSSRCSSCKCSKCFTLPIRYSSHLKPAVQLHSSRRKLSHPATGLRLCSAPRAKNWMKHLSGQESWAPRDTAPHPRTGAGHISLADGSISIFQGFHGRDTVEMCNWAAKSATNKFRLHRFHFPESQCHQYLNGQEFRPPRLPTPGNWIPKGFLRCQVEDP